MSDRADSLKHLEGCFASVSAVFWKHREMLPDYVRTDRWIIMFQQNI